VGLDLAVYHQDLNPVLGETFVGGHFALMGLASFAITREISLEGHLGFAFLPGIASVAAKVGSASSNMGTGVIGGGFDASVGARF
jgi:hypothetical protein